MAKLQLGQEKVGMYVLIYTLDNALTPSWYGLITGIYDSTKLVLTVLDYDYYTIDDAKREFETTYNGNPGYNCTVKSDKKTWGGDFNDGWLEPLEPIKIDSWKREMGF